VRCAAIGLLVAVGALVAPAGAGATTSALGIPCVPQSGVQLCQGDGAALRVPGWDGNVLLDVNVALPAGNPTNLPLIIQMHGWGGSKADLNPIPLAQRGYAVLSYTSRGFGNSCGSPASRTSSAAAITGCAQGWIKLMDTRYEIRDAQNLAGKLADAGLVDGQRVGSVGGSYGGGFSMALAALKDRVMRPDGSLGPWTSPGGKPMRIAAAAPFIPWTDLVYSLMPNGRTLDYAITPGNPDAAQSDGNPVGVQKRSFVAGLFGLGQASGYYSPPGADAGADLNQWYALTGAGEPYDANPQTRSVVDEIAFHHSSYYIDESEAPAPLFIANGFTDDLFPGDEAIRFYNRLRAHYPNSPIKLMFGDWGHQRGQNKTADIAVKNAAVDAWFDYYLKGVGSRPANDASALTQTCPSSAKSLGPFTAPTWAALAPGQVRLLSAGSQTILSAGGDPTVNRTVDPIAGGGACATTASGDLQGTATYRFPAAAGGGYTLLGSPTIQGNFGVTDATGNPSDAQIAARLWDVAPGGGAQTLVARALYRPRGSGLEVFQLHPNGYRFGAGHVAKLELLGNDEPYGRTSNGAFSITATNLDIRLPVNEQPGAAGGQVHAPAGLLLPAGSRLAPGQVQLRLGVRYRMRSVRAARRAACSWSSFRAKVTGKGLGSIKRVDFMVGSKRLARDGKAAFAATITQRRLRRNRSRSLRAIALLRDGRKVTLRSTVRSCSTSARARG
jgi:predicted acyl esterase